MFTLALLTAFYFLPTIVAAHHGHRVTGPLILNTLFGWTGIGWAALLMWALLSRPRVYVYPAVPLGTEFGSEYRYAVYGFPPRG